jgi:hypothetical protein
MLRNITKTTPDKLLTVTIGGDWAGVDHQNRHFLDIDINPDAMVNEHNRRWSEARAHAGKYIEALTRHLELPEGLTLEEAPGNGREPKLTDRISLRVNTPPRTVGGEALTGEDTIKAVQAAFETAHARAGDELGGPETHTPSGANLHGGSTSKRWQGTGKFQL